MKDLSMVEFFTAEDFAKFPAEMYHDDFASHCNRLLAERGVRVYGQRLGESNLIDQHGAGWLFGEREVRRACDDTHTAFLVGITSIKTAPVYAEITALLDKIPDSDVAKILAEMARRYVKSGLDAP